MAADSIPTPIVKPTLTRVVLIGHYSDGKRRQIIITQDEQNFILGVIRAVRAPGNNYKALTP